MRRTLYLSCLLFLTSNYYNAYCNGKVFIKITDTIQTDIIAIGAKPQLVSNQFSFTEGPAVDKHGNIFFTDQPNNKIWQYSVNGQLSVFMDNAGRSNGMYFDKKGNLIACADEHNQLWLITPKKQVRVLLKNFNGKLLNGPNDLWIDKKGGIYITDPYYQRTYWDRTTPDIKEQNVYYIATDKTVPVTVVNDMKQPNGIVGTPDGKYLYVADIAAKKTYRYLINAGGTLTEKILLIEQGSDGMTLDEHGNIYLTGKGVTVYNPSGKKIAHIDIPAKWTANVCFGGKGKNVLFITASESVYILQMKVKGVE